MSSRFHDRREAGRLLAQALSHYAGRQDVIVLALPRGGVPVACEVARVLSIPLDILMVHKVGVPHHAAHAMGAITSGGTQVLDDAVVREYSVSQSAIEHAVDHAVAELTGREHAYRGVLFGPNLRGQTVILVDDGVATGATMRAAVGAARRQEPARIVSAVPVAPVEACQILCREADEVVCLRHPEPFVSIDACYDHFPQVTDDEAREHLHECAQSVREAAIAAGAAVS